MSLIDVISKLPTEILGRSVAQKYNNQLPLLVKFIDAERDLSIQVHPDDKMALREHNKFGKTEMWYVIDAKPGAYLYAGFKEELTPEEFAEIIENSKNNNSCDSPTACGEQGRTSHTLLLDTFIDNRKQTNITTEGNKSLVRKITNFLHISK